MLRLSSTASSTPTELWSDPLTGARCQRHLLGSCLSGRLLTRPCRKALGTDLYWHGTDQTGAFDWQLQQMIEDAWHRLTPNFAHVGKIRSGDLDEPRPLRTRIKDLWWIARLDRGIYSVEEQDGGGCALYELQRLWIRRPGSTSRW